MSSFFRTFSILFCGLLILSQCAHADELDALQKRVDKLDQQVLDTVTGGLSLSYLQYLLGYATQNRPDSALLPVNFKVAYTHLYKKVSLKDQTPEIHQESIGAGVCHRPSYMYGYNTSGVFIETIQSTKKMTSNYSFNRYIRPLILISQHGSGIFFQGGGLLLGLGVETTLSPALGVEAAALGGYIYEVGASQGDVDFRVEVSLKLYLSELKMHPDL